MTAWRPVARGTAGPFDSPPADAWPEPLPAHAGLWLDRLVADPKPQGKGKPKDEEREPWPARRNLYLAAVAALAPGRNQASDPPALAAYRQVFRRWRRLVEKPDPGIACRVVEVEAASRLLLHPAANDTVTEGGLLLHHTYGVPYLTGSALKGVVRSRLERQRKVAAEEPGREGEERFMVEAIEELLGIVKRKAGEDQSRAALVDFLDALWIPEPPPTAVSGWSPLALDIVNPHHPTYYTVGKGRRQAPTDGDDPNPVPRLTVAPGSRFLVVLEAMKAPEIEPWLDWLVQEVLLPALFEDGIGGWTSAGYGRLCRFDPAAKSRPAPAGPGRGARREHVGPTPATPASPTWQKAAVSRNPGTGELTATLPDGRVATVGGQEAQKLLEAIPEAARQALMRKGKRRRPVELDVKAEPLGRRWRIAGLRAHEDET
jgi:CRISPR-associated protein Cmr6